MLQQEIDDGARAILVYEQFHRAFEQLSKEADLKPEQTTVFMTFGKSILFGQMLINAMEKSKNKTEKAEADEQTDNVIDYEKAKQS